VLAFYWLVRRREAHSAPAGADRRERRIHRPVSSTRVRPSPANSLNWSFSGVDVVRRRELVAYSDRPETTP